MSDAVTQRTIDILRPLVDAKTPQFIESAKVSLEERMMLASFVDAGLVAGEYRCDEMGRPSDFANLAISVAGRSYLADIEKKEEEMTSGGYLKKHAPKIIAWFFGILATVLAAWLVMNYVR